MAYREIWEIEVRHDGLNKYRHIRGRDRYVVEQKAIAQKQTWDEMWKKKQEAEKRRLAKEVAIQSREMKKELASAKTDEASNAIGQLETLLAHTLDIDDAIDWESLLDTTEFPRVAPTKPESQPVTPEPKPSSPEYQPKLGLLDKIFSGRRIRKENMAEKKFENDHQTWERLKNKIEHKNLRDNRSYNEKIEEWKKTNHCL